MANARALTFCHTKGHVLCVRRATSRAGKQQAVGCPPLLLLLVVAVAVIWCHTRHLGETLRIKGGHGLLWKPSPDQVVPFIAESYCTDLYPITQWKPEWYLNPLDHVSKHYFPLRNSDRRNLDESFFIFFSGRHIDLKLFQAAFFLEGLQGQPWVTMALVTCAFVTVEWYNKCWMMTGVLSVGWYRLWKKDLFCKSHSAQLQ